MEKILNLLQQKHTFINHKKRTTAQNIHKKLIPGLVAFYDIRPGKQSGSEVTTLWRYTNMFIIISKEKINKEKVEKAG